MVDYGIRAIQAAKLLGFGLVDRPAYPDPAWYRFASELRIEIRQDGDGLEGSFFYDQETIISDRAAQILAHGRFFEAVRYLRYAMNLLKRGKRSQ